MLLFRDSLNLSHIITFGSSEFSKKKDRRKVCSFFVLLALQSHLSELSCKNITNDNLPTEQISVDFSSSI